MSTYKYNYSLGGGIGRRKGLKIPREQSRAGSTPPQVYEISSLYNIFLLAGCTNIASQSVISSDLNIKVSQDDYGEYPKTYNVILKDYLIIILKTIKRQIEFVNAP